MKFYNVDEFIKAHIHFKQHWNKKLIGMKDAFWQTLEDDSYIGGCEYAKSSPFKVFETTNFGWIVFDSQKTKTPDGNIPGKMIWKW
jgi:hypothetical protein